MNKLKIFREGHRYGLPNVEIANSHQVIQFIEKYHSDAPNISDNLIVVCDGTTNEAVIEMVIDRLKYLNNKMPSTYNDDAIESLQDALTALETRTSDRLERDVEGTNKK